MNKINRLFSESRGKKILSLYFCAGCPGKEDTADILRAMQRRGIDMAEVGIPFSDPMADGPAIQDAAARALRNGMTLATIFRQLREVKDEIRIPVVLMGYLNPVMQYGMERFCRDCAESGVSGAIIPDLPFRDYAERVKPVADRYGIRMIMLITPETSEERIRLIDSHTDGFLYMVSSSATTGEQEDFGGACREYFRRVNAMNLRNPRMIGFGISNRRTLKSALENAAGAIIGSKFVTLLGESRNADEALDRLFRALD
ncbi:MAG: tryptophan synthase subunit alpha [Firmicutes bacterium]|nr:tryptophan synthase subunit alpha [Bacillota bacterium]